LLGGNGVLMTHSTPSTAPVLQKLTTLEDIVTDFALKQGVKRVAEQVQHVVSLQLFLDPDKSVVAHQTMITSIVPGLALELGALAYREYEQNKPIRESGIRGSAAMLLVYTGGSDIYVVHLVRSALIGRCFPIQKVTRQADDEVVFEQPPLPGYQSNIEFTVDAYAITLPTRFFQPHYDDWREKMRSASWVQQSGQVHMREVRSIDGVWGWHPPPDRDL
jgi:hypothetical protein